MRLINQPYCDEVETGTGESSPPAGNDSGSGSGNGNGNGSSPSAGTPSEDHEEEEECEEWETDGYVLVTLFPSQLIDFADVSVDMTHLQLSSSLVIILNRKRPSPVGYL